jgi:hypothetical protein
MMSRLSNRQKPKKKRKLSKAKQLRAAQKKTAKAFLSEILAHCEVSAAEAVELAKKKGIQIEALRRAKGSLGIRAVATESGSVWRLPQRNKQVKIAADSTDGGN